MKKSLRIRLKKTTRRENIRFQRKISIFNLSFSFCDLASWACDSERMRNEKLHWSGQIASHYSMVWCEKSSGQIACISHLSIQLYWFSSSCSSHLVPPPDQPLSSLSLSATSLMREIYLEFNAEQTSLFVCCASHEGAMSRRGKAENLSSEARKMLKLSLCPARQCARDAVERISCTLHWPNQLWPPCDKLNMCGETTNDSDRPQWPLIKHNLSAVRKVHTERKTRGFRTIFPRFV